MTCPRCLGEGVLYDEEHLGDGVYSTVDSRICGRCKGSGMVEEKVKA